ncbi:hypothetical protein FHS51_003207 [Sphingobium wenxiniae]|nr:MULTISPECIES: hypothetical protein [Sphingobium]MBB6192952.1 hypothetical protein [Sphingobium wenxiniae]WRD76885.1 hypothetical protein QQ987_01685 [Sphingobium baderi]
MNQAASRLVEAGKEAAMKKSRKQAPRKLEQQVDDKTAKRVEKGKPEKTNPLAPPINIEAGS